MTSRKKNIYNLVLFCFYILSFQGCSGGGGAGDGAGTITDVTSSPTVKISGFVYERQSSLSYSLDLSGVSTKIKCDTISLSGISTSCEADGTYSLSVPSPDYAPITINQSGYISNNYTVWGKTDQSIPIGLYRIPTVTPRPGFIKGMAYLDLGNTYPASFWPSIIDETATRMSAKLVSYVEVGFNHSCNAGSNTVAVSSFHPDYPEWRQPTKAELEPMVTKVHNAGMAFNLWLGVININECGGTVIYDWDPADTLFWDSWFNGYRTILLERTQVAKDLGIEWITLGHNMAYATAQAASRWAAIINDMKAIYPTVKITYFGGVNYSETPPYFESDGYNSGTPDGFASLLDSLGHTVTAVATVPNPSRNTIKATFEAIRDKTLHLSVPIWIMPMTPSITVGATDPTFMEPELSTDTVALSKTTDFYQQADVYQALFEVVNKYPAVGNGQIMGVLPWGYHLKNNYRDSGPESNSNPNINNLIVDRTANVRGKPAESIIKWWFDQL